MKTRLALAALGTALIAAGPAAAEPYGDPRRPRAEHHHHHDYAPRPVSGCHHVRQQVVDGYGRPLFDAYGRKQWRPVQVCD